jgi:hypothetical protein
MSRDPRKGLTPDLPQPRPLVGRATSHRPDPVVAATKASMGKLPQKPPLLSPPNINCNFSFLQTDHNQPRSLQANHAKNFKETGSRLFSLEHTGTVVPPLSSRARLGQKQLSSCRQSNPLMGSCSKLRECIPSRVASLIQDKHQQQR